MEKIEFGTRWIYNGSAEQVLPGCIKYLDPKQNTEAYWHRVGYKRVAQMVRRCFSHYVV